MPHSTEFLDPAFRYAVVGASTDVTKWGHKVFLALKDNGYQVTPINPNAASISGDRAYPTLPALAAHKGKPDLVVCVVQPSITELISSECIQLGITRLWMQPGAESNEAVRLCNGNNIQVMTAT